MGGGSEGELRRRRTTARNGADQGHHGRRQNTARPPGWSSPGQRRREDAVVQEEEGAADEEADITLSSTTGVASTVAVCLLLSWWGIEPWDVISAMASIAVIVLTLYLPRSLLVAATVDQLGQQQPGSSIEAQLWRRRILATVLMVAAPAVQFYAIAHLQSLSETPGWRVLSPGFVAICSSLYALNTITRDHVAECGRLQAKRVRGDRLIRRVAALENAVADIRYKLDGYKGILQSSIHTIARVRSGEGETEVRLEDLAAQIERLQRRLSHHERTGSTPCMGSLPGSPVPHFAFPLHQHHHQQQQQHSPLPALQRLPLHKRISTTVARLVAVLVTVEWPWRKVRRLLRVLAGAAGGDDDWWPPVYPGHGGASGSEFAGEEGEGGVFEARPRRRRRLTSSSSTQTPRPAATTAHEQDAAQLPGAATTVSGVTTPATAATTTAWARPASTPNQGDSSAFLASVESAASNVVHSGYVAVNGDQSHPDPCPDSLT